MSCKECHGPLFDDSYSGDCVCTACGLVQASHLLISVFEQMEEECQESREIDDVWETFPEYGTYWQEWCCKSDEEKLAGAILCNELQCIVPKESFNVQSLMTDLKVSRYMLSVAKRNIKKRIEPEKGWNNMKTICERLNKFMGVEVRFDEVEKSLISIRERNPKTVIGAVYASKPNMDIKKIAKHLEISVSSIKQCISDLKSLFY